MQPFDTVSAIFNLAYCQELDLSFQIFSVLGHSLDFPTSVGICFIQHWLSYVILPSKSYG
jgi:hypothetical protein